MEKQRDNHIEQNVTEQHTTEQGGIYRKIRDFALDETGVGVIELKSIFYIQNRIPSKMPENPVLKPFFYFVYKNCHVCKICRKNK